MKVIPHRRGDTFSELVAMPSNFFLSQSAAEGGVTATVSRDPDYEDLTAFSDELQVTLRSYDPAPDGLVVLAVESFDTTAWPAKKLRLQVTLTRALEVGGEEYIESSLPTIVEVRT